MWGPTADGRGAIRTLPKLLEGMNLAQEGKPFWVSSELNYEGIDISEDWDFGKLMYEGIMNILMLSFLKIKLRFDYDKDVYSENQCLK